MPLLHINQRTDEWLTARRGKITASLAAACLSLDPYKSRAAAWREIMGMGSGLQNRHMQWGVQFEAAARLDYEVLSGHIVEETGLWQHPTVPWLAASPDGLIGREGLVEIKCPTEPPQSVPIHHRIQCLIQLACTERLWCDYYSWGAGHHAYIARVHRAGIPGLIAKLAVFYRKYVETGIEPPRKKRKRS
jgi:putative phage-type endonuclease